MTDMLSVNDMAKELNVTTRTIRNYLSEGKIEGVKIGGQWRFPKSELHKFFGETVNNAIIDFIEDEDNNDFNGVLILTIPINDDKKIEDLKKRILHQYNTVYNGNSRTLSYQKKSDKKAILTLQGPQEYIISFGNWISNQLSVYNRL